MIFRPKIKSEDSGDFSLLGYLWSRARLFSFTDRGDTYVMNEVPDNAFGYGQKSVYSYIQDGLGDATDITAFDVAFELYRSVTNVSETSYDFIKSGDYYGATSSNQATATYISNVLSVNDDFGYWKTISWFQTCRDARVVVAVKTADTVAELLEKDWDRYFEQPCTYYSGSYTGTLVTRDLDFFNLRGGHMMFKIEFSTDSPTTLPSVRDLVVSYAGKHSVFFFSNKIIIDSTSFDELIMTASVTLPAKTEIAFGIGPGDSVDWKDYEIVDLGRLKSVPDLFRSRMRVGVRFSSYDIEKYPVVHEYALSFQGDATEQMNVEA